VIKNSAFIFLILYLFSSELTAQNLFLKITGSSDDETTLISEFDYNTKQKDYNSILIEVNAFQKKIIKAGYIENDYSVLRKINDSLFLAKFQLGNKYDKIEIRYDSTKISKSIIDLVCKDSNSNYFTIPFTEIEETLVRINNEVSNDGFPFSKIKLSEIKIKDNKTLQSKLILIINDKRRSLDNIVVKGYEKFPKSYLNRFLKIKPEAIFNISTIKNKMNALNNLRFAEQIKAPEVLFTKDSTVLYIYLKKLQSNTFDGFLGFSTNEETNKIDFNGYINLELNNNLNYGESFNLIYKSDESEQKNFDVNLTLPYLFSSPIGTEIALNILKRDSTFTSINQKASVFYQLNAKNKFFLGVESIESNNLLEDDFNFEIADYNSINYNLKYTFENRNNFYSLFRIKSRIWFEFGLGNRKTVDKRESQKRILLDALHTFQLNSKNSFYTRVNGAIIQSKNYFENELFRFGGINSIRGFQENSIIANKYIVLNTEYRYQLSQSIYEHSIIDFGNFDNKISEINENLYGFGLGFWISTKAGLLKFNFANGKSEKQNFKFSNSKIHLSLVSIF